MPEIAPVPAPLPPNWPSLLQAVAQSLLDGRPQQALVWSYLSLVAVDTDAYARMSQHDCACPQAQVQAVQEALSSAWLDRSEGLSAAALASALGQAAGRWPLAVLRWLDGLALAPGLGCETSEDLYSPVSRISLPVATLRRLELPEAWQQVQLLRREGPLPRAQASVAMSHVWPLLHLPHWCVLPEQPKRDQPSRRVLLCRAGGAFAQDCQRLAALGQVKVALVELPEASAPVFDSAWWPEGRKPLWQARGLLNEAQVQAALLAAWAQAQADGADVLVLPELVVPPGVRRALSEAMYQHAVRQPEAHRLTAVVAGSFHVPHPSQAGAVVNQAWVLDGWGEEVRTEGHAAQPALPQCKFTSVDLSRGAEVVEYNHKADTLHLAHTALGVHAVGICLDVAQVAESDRLYWAHLPVRWLWCPSLSETTRAHQSRAKEFSLHWRLSVACANQAVADFGTVPGGPALALHGTPGQSFVMDTWDQGKLEARSAVGQVKALKWQADEQF